MAEITAALVKELRDKTGAGMMDCKKALAETAGDLESAFDWLRKKGLAAAAKKAGRVAAEGLIGLATDGARGALVEVNAETDFVARNEQFQGFVREVAKLALGVDSLEALAKTTYPGAGQSVADKLTQLIATVGENMTLRRMTRLTVGKGAVVGYVHNAAAPGLGKIGVLVALESTGDQAKLAGFGKQLAMHVAAASPQALDVKSVDPASLERERAVLTEQARASGRPEEIIAKMVEGRLRKFYEEVVLLEQTYVIDNESKVKAAVAAAAKDAGAPVEVTGFRRLVLGEGVEREQKDFAAEVAAQLAR
jgi:elongation factor Ts